MGTSKNKIYNIVINILGISNPIIENDGEDTRAFLLDNYYELAKEFVLKDYDWNFASIFKPLEIFEEENESKYKFEYCYLYPDDCICARDVFSKGSYILEEFEIATNLSGEKIIITNALNAILRYTREVNNEAFFSCEFSMALSFYLASLTAGVLTGSMQKGELAYEKYKQIIKKAKVLNANEGNNSIYTDTTYLDSRG